MGDVLNIKDLLDEQAIDDGVWVPFKDTNFKVKIAYYGKQQMQQLYEKCKVKTFNPRLARFDEDVDTNKFRKIYADTVIRDWSGLTIEVLSKLIPVKGTPDPKAELACTPDNKVVLVTLSMEFDQWLAQIATDVEAFNQAKAEAELKN